jgi:eukaryotic-like serine/threonine-protein kinase
LETDLVDPDRPGALLAGRFRLERALGRGASAVVWEATHVLTGRVLALKVFAASPDGERPGTDARKRRERLLREARAASRTKHPHVLPIDDVLELPDGRAALVMPRLLGESLRQRLTQREKLLVEEVRALFAPVVEALLSAHAAGVVHRDFKPDNLFVTDEPARLVILDFGIAKLIHDSDVGLTSTGVTVGTPLYMAPEQLFGEDDVDGRADAWALGVVLHECLSGVRPTEATNLGQLLKRVSGQTLRVLTLDDVATASPPSAARREKDKQLVDLVNRLLTVERTGRPPLTEVLAGLRGEAADVSVPVPAPTSVSAEIEAPVAPSEDPAPGAETWTSSARLGAALGVLVLAAGLTVGMRSLLRDASPSSPSSPAFATEPPPSDGTSPTAPPSLASSTTATPGLVEEPATPGTAAVATEPATTGRAIAPPRLGTTSSSPSASTTASTKTPGRFAAPPPAYDSAGPPPKSAPSTPHIVEAAPF